MPAFKPIKRPDPVHYLRKFGYTGPFAGGKHEFMLKGEHSITIPNPHRTEIGKGFLRKILKQATISIEEWEEL